LRTSTIFTTPVFDVRIKVVDFCGWTERKDGPAAKLKDESVLRFRVSNILTNGSGIGLPLLNEEQLMPTYKVETDIPRTPPDRVYPVTT
jgi:hypothetical protein